MEKAVIIFSIDDGRHDLYELAKEILIPNNVPATFNITTERGYSKTIPSITKEQLLEIAESPLFEIANHSRFHTNELEDIRNGYLDICELFGYDSSKPIGFASPYSQLSIEFVNENIEALNGLGVKYVRTCREDYFNRDENVVALTSFPVSFHTTLEEMKHLADVAVENKYCLIYLMHSVFKKDDANYGNEWSYDYEKFAELVSYLKELEHDGKIDIMTTMDYVDMQMKK